MPKLFLVEDQLSKNKRTLCNAEAREIYRSVIVGLGRLEVASSDARVGFSLVSSLALMMFCFEGRGASLIAPANLYKKLLPYPHPCPACDFKKPPSVP